LIVECNQLAVDIDNEISTVHNFVRDKYRSKFPELESLVMHPVDYSRVVKAIANEMVCMPRHNQSGTLEPLAPFACELGTTFQQRVQIGQRLLKC